MVTQSVGLVFQGGLMPFNLRGPELLVLFLLLLVVVCIVVVVIFAVKAATKSSPTVVPPTVPQSPGWYPVPDGSGRVAWWDGVEWTEPPAATGS